MGKIARFSCLKKLGSAGCSNRSLETEDVETHHHAMPASTTHPLLLLLASSLPHTWVQEDPTQQSRFCFQFFDDPTRRTWLGGSGFVRQRIFFVCNNNFLSLLSRFTGHMAIPILACCNPFPDHQALACSPCDRSRSSFPSFFRGTGSSTPNGSSSNLDATDPRTFGLRLGKQAWIWLEERGR